ncbi:GAF domain-containing protein [Marichromatium sp. AB32]|uniref:GAF domain-containing protein n=1 Tax=Marichromatium sp. AB32 TaxID=2483363 RepID=UPI000F3D2905|nr:GAF domain-containing protein [Marichromatium sp. AB32]RNE94264.1 GAF domain-containing protein [Marichromatium sp. AB32]
MSELATQGFIAECEREQLQRAQSIQPCGALLGGRPGDARIRFASANLAHWLGEEAQAVLGRLLTSLLPDFPPPSVPGTEEGGDDAWLRPSSDKRFYPDLCIGPRGALDALLSCSAETWLLEFEPALAPAERHAAYRPVPHQLYRMPYSAEDWSRQCQFLVDTLRHITGFSRVLLYRFRDDDCGEVVAESLREGLDPYLGLRYPASDIPQIARRLYLLNPHRQIPDIAAAPVPLLADPEGTLADLTLSELRAVSPVHLTYLRNMGVSASLSFSLVVSGRLWGLIACHHDQPAQLAPALRARCAEMARAFTLAIYGYQSTRRLMDVSESDREIAALVERLGSGGNIESVATAGEGSLAGQLLALVGASGAALIDGERCTTFGQTPPCAALLALCRWLEASETPTVFATAALAEHYPPAREWRDRGSGLLAVRVERAGVSVSRTFLWWRPEQPQEVHWAGDPRKDALVRSGDGELSPRASFARWVEVTSGQAEPWGERELLRAKRFRGLILHAINADLLGALGAG